MPEQVAQALKTESVRQQLALGKVVTAAFTPNKPTKGVSMWATLEIYAPLEDIVAAINLCEQAVKWHKKLKSCKRLHQEPGFAEFEQRVKFSWYLPELEYVFRASYPNPDEIRFQAISGDIKTLQGGWNLYPNDESTLAVYFITIQPKLPSPKWLVEKTLKSDLPKMLRTISDIATSNQK